MTCVDSTLCMDAARLSNISCIEMNETLHFFCAYLFSLVLFSCISLSAQMSLDAMSVKRSESVAKRDVGEKVLSLNMGKSVCQGKIQ